MGGQLQSLPVGAAGLCADGVVSGLFFLRSQSSRGGFRPRVRDQEWTVWPGEEALFGLGLAVGTGHRRQEKGKVSE